MPQSKTRYHLLFLLLYGCLNARAVEDGECTEYDPHIHCQHFLKYPALQLYFNRTVDPCLGRCKLVTIISDLSLAQSRVLVRPAADLQTIYTLPTRSILHSTRDGKYFKHDESWNTTVHSDQRTIALIPWKYTRRQSNSYILHSRRTKATSSPYQIQDIHLGEQASATSARTR